MSEHAKPNSDITQLIQAVIHGDENSRDYVDLVYGELHRIARSAMRSERVDHTLQPTALVNEAYMRLSNQKRLVIKDRGHFYAVAATIMRRILVDHARAHNAACRGGDLMRVSMEDVQADNDRDLDLLAIDEQLTILAKLDPRKAKMLEMKYFAGLGIAEICSLTELAPSTVHKELNKARAWLYTQLNP